MSEMCWCGVPAEVTHAHTDSGAAHHPAFGAVCRHGSLARSCFACESEQTIATLTAELAETRALLARVTSLARPCQYGPHAFGCNDCDARAYLARGLPGTPTSGEPAKTEPGT